MNRLWLLVPTATLGILLFASLYAQPSSAKPTEAVDSINSSNGQILKLDFGTGRSTVIDTDARLRTRLEGLTVRSDGSTVHILVADSKRGEVLFYENAAGAGQLITTRICFPVGMSLDLAGNADRPEDCMAGPMA